jgi:hypothetical protein
MAILTQITAIYAETIIVYKKKPNCQKSSKIGFVTLCSQEFRQLVRDAVTKKISAGDLFSLENETIIQPKLHLLMKG